MDYSEFLQSKKHSSIDFGIDVNFLPNSIFDYQKHVAEYAIKKGRCATFLDTGLGKTIIELTIAQNFVNATGKPVLIITPLAVAFQFIKEAAKFGITDIDYSKDGKIKSKIVVCNYERLDKFTPDMFDCVVLDESSILKNFDGAIKNTITSFLKKVKYRFLSTATPSPNDFIELGTSSEALGYLGYTDMLGKFFKNNQGSIDIRHTGSEWYLKPHAENDFWRWVASWSISMRKPSDIGYSDDLHVLPELIEVSHMVKNPQPIVVDGQFSMFNFPATNFREIKSEVRSTIKERCEKASEVSMGHEISVHWVNLNDEAKIMREINPQAQEIKGDMNLDHKEELLLAFANGEISKLITKTSITAFGLNWQHCNHTTYFPTYSYEQYYQAIRRFHRFGQKRNVHVDLILSDGQTKIMESLQAKKNKADEMFSNLTKQTNSDFNTTTKEFNKQITLPNFLRK